MSLSTQTNKLASVINYPETYSYEDVCDLMIRLNIWLCNESNTWCWVHHCLDCAPDENGDMVAETPHIHMCGVMKRTRVRLSTWLRELSDALQLNESYIHVQVMTSFDGCVVYYSHEQEPDWKVRYAVSELHSNVPSTELRSIIDNYVPPSIKEESIDGLVEIVQTSKNKLEIMRKVGLTRYVVFRNVIAELIQELGWMPELAKRRKSENANKPNIGDA